MYTTADFLKVSPWEALIMMINANSHTSLIPRLTELVSLTPLTQTETMVSIRANISASSANTGSYIDTGTYRYDRLQLSDYFDGFVLSGIQTPISTHDLIVELRRLTGYVLELDDFVQRNADENSLTLTAAPESLRWVGEATVVVADSTVSLSEHVVNRSFPNLLPNLIGPGMQGAFYSVRHNFSNYHDYLKGIRVGFHDYDGIELAQILELVTGDPWVCSSQSTPFNVAGSISNGQGRPEVLYNGVAISSYTPRLDLPRCLIVGITSSLCSNMSGHLIISY